MSQFNPEGKFRANARLFQVLFQQLRMAQTCRREATIDVFRVQRARNNYLEANMNSRSKDTVALGTSPDFCFARKEQLHVPFLGFDAAVFPGLRQDIRFVYDTEGQADAALQNIERRLIACVDDRSIALATEYSNANLLSFLAEYLARDGLMFMRWSGIVRLQSTGLECYLPNESWEEVHVEDLVDTDADIEWQAGKPDPFQGAGGGVYAHRKFGLGAGMTWFARTTISRPIADSQLLPW